MGGEGSIGLTPILGRPLQPDLLNLLDPEGQDLDYHYRSRLSGEPPVGVGDVHFHIFEPRQVQRAAADRKFGCQRQQA
jgi:hypothetical protein